MGDSSAKIRVAYASATHLGRRWSIIVLNSKVFPIDRSRSFPPSAGARIADAIPSGRRAGPGAVMSDVASPPADHPPTLADPRASSSRDPKVIR
jgi:hypothetical protein